MLIFGHTGITLATAVLLNAALAKHSTPSTRKNRLSGTPKFSSEKSSHQGRSSNTLSWFTSLGSRVDIRLLLIASLLPDIIDKPLGLFLFHDLFGTGRMFFHTLLFLSVITLVGLYLYISRKKTWLLVLSFGTFTHLIFDAMWQTPQTFLWPLYGFSFERHDSIALIDWIQELYRKLLIYPVISVPELVGATVMIWFAWRLVHKRNLYAFIRNGRV